MPEGFMRSFAMPFRIRVGLLLVAATIPNARAWAGAVTIPTERQPNVLVCQANGNPCISDFDCPNQIGCVGLDLTNPNLVLVIPPVTAQLVLSVDDDPPWDLDPTVACNQDVSQACIPATAGLFSVAHVQLSGRLPKGKKGGKPFSVSLSLPACDVPIHQYTTSSDFPNAGNVQRLTETSLLQLRAQDFLFQPLPSAVAVALRQELHLSSGTPVITNADSLTTTATHDQCDAQP